MLTVEGGESWEQAGGFPGSGGSKALTIPVGTTAILLWAWTNNANHGIEPSSVALGGVAATYIGEGDPFPEPHSVHAWEVLDISARSNDTLSWGAVAFQDQLWAVAYVGGSNPARVDAGVAVGGTSPTAVTLTPIGGDNLALILGANDGTADLADIGPGAGQTQIVEAATSLANDAVVNLSYLDGIASPTSVGFAHSAPGANRAGIGILLAEGIPSASTGTIGAEFGWQDGVEAAISEDVTAYLVPSLGVEFGWRDGIRLRAGGRRQVMLTGSKLHTPEMTEDGNEGDQLTQHLDRPPTWEPGSGNPALDAHVWMALTSVVDGEPVLVWDDDDSLIPTLVPLE